MAKMWIFGFSPRVCPIEPSNLVFSMECLVSNGRRALPGGIRLGGSATGYHPHRGRCYDSGEDRSPSPGLPGPQAFGRHILNAAFPPWYRPPTNILKYFGEMNLGLWFENYWLACQASGADNDDFIIRNLPLFLADSARTWLEHLPPNRI